MITSRPVFSSYETFFAAVKAAGRIEFASPETNLDKDVCRAERVCELDLDALTKVALTKRNKTMPLADKMLAVYEALQLHLKGVDIKSEADQNASPICLEQRFAAFSDSSVINAVNVISCVFLVLVHRNSKFTFGAHIDGDTTTQDISNAIALFLKKIGDPNAELTCHLLGGDTTTLDLGTLVKIYHALKGLNVAIGAHALRACGINDDPITPLHVAYDPQMESFYFSKVAFSNKLRKIQATIFYILCNKDVAQPLPLHVIASHRGDEFEYYPLRITHESLISWMNSAKEKEFEKHFVKSMIRHLDNWMLNDTVGPMYGIELDDVLYEIAEAYKYADSRLNNQSVFFKRQLPVATPNTLPQEIELHRKN